MSTFFVTCHTPDNLDRDRRIQGLGGTQNGYTWWKTIDDIIDRIDRLNEVFFTAPAFGDGAKVITAVHPTSRRKYLKTVRDGLEPNNLLSLPNCRA